MENKETKHKKSRKKRKHKKSHRSKPSSSIHNSSVAASVGLGLGRLSSDFEIFPQLGLQLQDNLQCDWFWENYRNAMGWQGRHQVAYWRSRALASEHQNRLLLDYVEHNTGREVTIQYQQSREQAGRPIHNNHENQDYQRPREGLDSDSSSESFVFEVNEEMLSFFEQSMKHKTELRKQREEEKKELLEENLDSLNAGALLSTLLVGRHEVAEKTSFYGKNATTIIALETSMQLSFERYLDENKPKLWPNIPLKL